MGGKPAQRDRRLRRWLPRRRGHWIMIKKDGADHPAPRSHVFILRIWPEEMGGGEIEWRGKVQHVTSGEARYFRDWPTLQTFVEELLRAEPETRGRGDTETRR